MGLFSNKRGNLVEIVLNPLFRLLIFLTVIVLLLNYTTNIGKSSYYEREFLVRDTGLIIEALHASPNDVTLEYPNTKGMNLTFKKDMVIASKYDEPSRKSSFPIIPSKIELVESSFGPRVEKTKGKKDAVFAFDLFFEKAGNVILPKAEETRKLSKKQNEIYEYIDTLNSNWESTENISIIVRSTSDEGKDFGNAVCRDLILDKGDMLPGETDYCRLTNSATTKPEDASIVIIIYVNEDQKDINKLNVYYFNGQGGHITKSKKLAKITLDSLSETRLYTSVGSTGTTPSYINNAIRDIDLAGKVAIVIEVGNVEYLKDENIKTIAGAIFGGIKTYYS